MSARLRRTQARWWLEAGFFCLVSGCLVYAHSQIPVSDPEFHARKCPSATNEYKLIRLESVTLAMLTLMSALVWSDSPLYRVLLSIAYGLILHEIPLRLTCFASDPDKLAALVRCAVLAYWNVHVALQVGALVEPLYFIIVSPGDVFVFSTVLVSWFGPWASTGPYLLLCILCLLLSKFLIQILLVVISWFFQDRWHLQGRLVNVANESLVDHHILVIEAGPPIHFGVREGDYRVSVIIREETSEFAEQIEEARDRLRRGVVSHNCLQDNFIGVTFLSDNEIFSNIRDLNARLVASPIRYNEVFFNCHDGVNFVAQSICMLSLPRTSMARTFVVSFAAVFASQTVDELWLFSFSSVTKLTWIVLIVSLCGYFKLPPKMTISVYVLMITTTVEHDYSMDSLKERYREVALSLAISSSIVGVMLFIRSVGRIVDSMDSLKERYGKVTLSLAISLIIVCVMLFTRIVGRDVAYSIIVCVMLFIRIVGRGRW